VCDELSAKRKAAALEKRWADVVDCHARFCRPLDTHLRAEESVLFLVFESTTGS